MLFPPRFDPSALQGPRAKQHLNRPDAFQQLVGDALREKFGFRVAVSPTKGRDGAIDAFIDDKTGGSALAHLPAPQIIECKDHDDTCEDLQKNINQGWDRVASKLKEQAETGWTGDFEPWRRVKSYVYCISSNIGKQASRDKLEEKIVRFFFDELSDSTRPPLLEEILVLDWSDLQDSFNRFPRIADKWIGLQLPKIQSHAEYCESLTQFRRYLLEDNFPFVAPEQENDNACPANILTRLEQLAGTGGVLLEGIGGVGKTRTALEVAQLADVKGWRVLHLLPGEPGVTVEELSEVLFLGNEQTLLVFDYLDHMPKLDLGSVRHRILPEAAKRGIKLALLANLRPSSLRNRNAEREALFTEQISLQTSASQKARITETALERIAPLAVAQLGHEQVHELCGERPIIAMFIAEELQRRAQKDTLGKAELTGIRNDDLTSWLRKRLIEDKLVVIDNGDSFLPAQPDPLLIAAVAMLAAAPLSRDNMEEAGSKAFLAAGGDVSQKAALVLDRLLKLDWLEQRGNELSAAHDVVADEIFNEVLWDRNSGQFRETVLEYCLTSALDRARTLGRYATAITRLQGSEKTETKKEAALHETAGYWLGKHCSELGQMLATTEAGESAYALGNIVSTPGWATVCIANWSQLIAPWLNNHSLHPEARHLLYRGLKELPEGTVQELINTALKWLPDNLNSVTASYVLGPLLKRKELNEQNACLAIDFAMQWLEKFPLMYETEFVLHSLLSCNDLGEYSKSSIHLAIQWLESFHFMPETEFILSSLLKRTDLAQYSVNTIDFTMQWLEKYHLFFDARFVFQPLLARNDLNNFSYRTIEFAINWLKMFPLIIETRFVLDPLLVRNDLNDRSSQVIEFAINWIKNFPLFLETGFVLDSLLSRNDLGNKSEQAINLSIDWSQQFQHTSETDFVITRLLARSDLDGRSMQVIDLALNWMQQFQLVPDAKFVIAQLLERNDLGKPSMQVIDLALNWICHLQLPSDADFVIARLLQRNDLADRSMQVIDLALNWVQQFQVEPDADFVIARLLERKDLADRLPQAIDLALNWFQKSDLTLETRFIITPILEQNDLKNRFILIIKLTFQWIKKFIQLPEAQFVLAPLLGRKDLGVYSSQAIEKALSWIKLFLLHNHASFVFKPLLRRKDLENHSVQAISFAVQWLNHFSPDVEASYVLAPLLSRNDLGNHSAQAITIAIKWVNNNSKIPTAQFVCKSLLSRNDIEPSARIHLQELLDRFYKSDNQFINPEIAHELTDAALGKREKPNIQRLEEIVEIMANAIKTSRPVPAAFMLPGLLAIVQPSEEPELWKKIIELANQILEHPKFLTNNKIKLANSIWYLVYKNAWPEELAKPVLEELGLDRPSSSNRPEHPAT